MVGLGLTEIKHTRPGRLRVSHSRRADPTSRSSFSDFLSDDQPGISRSRGPLKPNHTQWMMKGTRLRIPLARSLTLVRGLDLLRERRIVDVKIDGVVALQLTRHLQGEAAEGLVVAPLVLGVLDNLGARQGSEDILLSENVPVVISRVRSYPYQVCLFVNFSILDRTFQAKSQQSKFLPRHNSTL